MCTYIIITSKWKISNKNGMDDAHRIMFFIVYVYCVFKQKLKDL